MSTLRNDVRFALRFLWRRPGMTVAALVTLAIAIGANTAVFSVTNAVLVRPLPLASPDRLVMFWESNPKLQVSIDDLPVSQGDFSSWRSDCRSFERLAAFGTTEAALTGAGEPERLGGASVSPEFFDVVGIAPAVGRGFIATDGVAGGPHAVVLSHDVWARRFASNRSIVGRPIVLDDEPCTVVGVMPAGFAYPRSTDLPSSLGGAPRCQFWRAMSVGDDRANRQLAVIGRLVPSATASSAQAEMDVVAARLAEAYPDSNGGYGVRVRSLNDQIVGSVRPAIFVLEAAVALVLLVACANLANLMLVRTATRRREIAVRLAIGASRSRIVAQLLVESLVLAVLGGAAGSIVAVLGLQTVVAVAPPNIPRLDEVRLDPAMVAFALGVTLLAGVAFGLLPALQASHVDVQEALKDGVQPGGARLRRTRSSLVVAQVAILTVLLSSTGLAVRSFLRLVSVSPGFDESGVATAVVPLARTRYAEPARATAFFDEAVAKLQATPGIVSAAAVSDLPLSGGVYAGGFSVRERPDLDDAEGLVADRRIVDGPYFDTLRIPVVSGRAFTDGDRRDVAAVAVVSEAFARRFIPQADPVGMHVKLGGPDSERPWLEIVGVVGDVRDAALAREATPHIYVPMNALPVTTMTLVARGDGSRPALESTLRETVLSLDAQQATVDARPLAAYVDDALVAPRFAVAVLSGFAVVALVLAGVGLFGVVAYAVANRTREIGIRMALGAEPRAAVRLVVGEGIPLVVAGTVIGSLVSIATTRWVASELYDVRALDPLMLAAVAAMLAIVAFAACYLPARRATRVDPAIALRNE